MELCAIIREGALAREAIVAFLIMPGSATSDCKLVPQYYFSETGNQIYIINLLLRALYFLSCDYCVEYDYILLCYMLHVEILLFI